MVAGPEELVQGKWVRDSTLWGRLKPRVRQFRREATPAERLLWMQLRNSQIEGRKFRRQHPIGQFVADFCCPSAKLVVELDGGIHGAQLEEDRTRQSFLEGRGYRVLRFPNGDVLRSPGAVLAQIADALRAPLIRPENE